MPSNKVLKVITVTFLAVFLLLSLSCSKDPATHVTKGKEYMGQGKYAEAIIEFKNALKKDPQTAEAHYQLGLAYLNQSADLREPYGEFERTITLDKSNLEAQIRFGNLLLLRNNFAEYNQCSFPN